jgi:phage-related protein
VSEKHKPLLYASVTFEGDSLTVLSGFPDEVKTTLGFELRKVQKGERPSSCKPLPGIGNGLWELREQDGQTWYRVAYIPRKNDQVYVLHSFEKDGNDISKKDSETIDRRYRAVKARLLEEKKR